MRCLNYIFNILFTKDFDILSMIHWWVDAGFVVHPYLKIHTLGTITLEICAVVNISKNSKYVHQYLNRGVFGQH